jgi:hypothetical protein
MALFIDRKFVFLAGMKLARFKQKGDYLFNFRAPCCGDSKKSKIKSRGYFYRKKDSMLYACHNCNASMSLGSFLRDFDPHLYQEYQLESYLEKGSVRPSTGQQTPVKKDTAIRVVKLPDVASLSPDHTARQYVTRRKIPVVWWQEIFYADDFKKFCYETFDAKRLEEKGLREGEARLVLPWYDKNGRLAGVQGRSFSNSAVRYITLKADEDEDKLFGLHKINFQKPVYVLEGPIDSMFLPNAVATMDSALWRAEAQVGKDAIYVYDNEPRNRQVVGDIKKTIDKGLRVVIWPQGASQKDVNDMVLDGVDVMSVIESRTFEGIRAKLEFDLWRKM